MFRLFDLANILLLIAVAPFFFLPLLVQEIGPFKAELTGIHLASGKKPGKGTDYERSLDRTGKPLPKDRTLWLVPALGILGALAASIMLLQPDARTSRFAIIFAVVPLLFVLGWFLVMDFQIEAAEKAEWARVRSELGADSVSDHSIHKSVWFYASLGFSVLAFTLASLRKFSPWVSFRRPEASARPRTPPSSPSTVGSSGARPTRGSPS